MMDDNTHPCHFRCGGISCFLVPCQQGRANRRAQQTFTMRRLTACLAIAVGAVQGPFGNAAVGTVWTATEVHGGVHELGQPAEQRQQPAGEGLGGENEGVQARGRYASNSLLPVIPSNLK